MLEYFKQFLTSSDFICRVNLLIENAPKESRARSGKYKLFYSEVYPIKTLLEAKKRIWQNIKIKLYLDKKNHADAQIQGLKNIEYLEITEVGFDKYEYFSMLQLNKTGYSWPISPDRKIDDCKKFYNTNKNTSILFRTYCREDAYQQFVEHIINAINKKQQKYTRYNRPNTALLVSVDDYGRIGQVDLSGKLTQLLKATNFNKGPFTNIAIVGRGRNTLYFEFND